MVDQPTLNAIFNRRSHPRLVPPAPSEEGLGILVRAAHSAPDHHHCTPFRHILLTQSLKDQLAASQSDPEGVQRKLSRAPLILAAIYSPAIGSRTPQSEQRDSAAASVENLLIAATAMGVGSIWRTGALAYSPLVHDLLDLAEHEQIMGWIYLGTAPDK